MYGNVKWIAKKLLIISNREVKNFIMIIISKSANYISFKILQ